MLGIQQGAATIKFGPTASPSDVSLDVHVCELKITFDQATRKPTFGNPKNLVYAGAANVSIIVNFESDNSYSNSSLGGMVANAVFNAVLAATPSTPILYYDLVFDNTAVGVANKRYTGTVSVLEAFRGGEVTQMRTVDITFPVLTIAEATS